MSFIDASPVFPPSRSRIEGGSFAREMSLGRAFGAILANYRAGTGDFQVYLPLPTLSSVSRIHLRTGSLKLIQLLFNHLPAKTGDLPNSLSESLTDSGELVEGVVEKTVIRNMLIVSYLGENIAPFWGRFWGWHSPCE